MANNKKSILDFLGYKVLRDALDKYFYYNGSVMEDEEFTRFVEDENEVILYTRVLIHGKTLKEAYVMKYKDDSSAYGRQRKQNKKITQEEYESVLDIFQECFVPWADGEVDDTVLAKKTSWLEEARQVWKNLDELIENNDYDSFKEAINTYGSFDILNSSSLLYKCWSAGPKWLDCYYSVSGINYIMIEEAALNYAIYEKQDKFAIYLLSRGVAPFYDDYGDKIPLLRWIAMINNNETFPSMGELKAYLLEHQ